MSDVKCYFSDYRSYYMFYNCQEEMVFRDRLVANFLQCSESLKRIIAITEALDQGMKLHAHRWSTTMML